MFEKILIANRGEIALRINRACKEMGIATVAIHSTADADAMHVRLADESVCVGPPPAAQSYLNIPAIIAACEITGAEAIHPGYGFLSENANFAEIVEEHGITFIGPTPEHIRMMGDKITAKQTVKAAGHSRPCRARTARSPTRMRRAVAAEIGYPVLIKATAGGGGRGMKVAQNAGDLSLALSTARAEAKTAFGNDTVYMEKYLQKPRHIEIQILADSHGTCHPSGRARLFAAAPPPEGLGRSGLALRSTPQQRDEIGGVVHRRARPSSAISAPARSNSCYEDGRFYFIEMNTRLQVEHPVTEAITGIDIVREQIRIAAGGALEIDAGRRRRSTAMPSNAASMRRIPSPSGPRPALITQFHSPGGLGRALRFRDLCRLPHPALLRQPGGQADRAWPQPQRMPAAAAPRAGRAGGGRHRDHHSAVPEAGARARHHQRRLLTSTGWNSGWRRTSPRLISCRRRQPPGTLSPLRDGGDPARYSSERSSPRQHSFSTEQ